jgi:hypothetical protein
MNAKKILMGVAVAVIAIISFVTGIFANQAVTNQNSKEKTDSTSFFHHINGSYTKSIYTDSWTEIASDNNLLNESVAITHTGVPQGNPEQSIIVKVDTSTGTKILTDVELAIGDTTTFHLPFDSGIYRVWAKSVSTDGDVTIKITD